VRERLNPLGQQETKEMVLNDRPTKYGIEREIWTGKIIAFVIKQRWGVDLKTPRIYEILDNLNLSHQKTHRDYENASPEKQKEFVKMLKKNAPRESVGRKFYSLMNSPQYITDQVHTMDGQKRILDLKCHQMKVKRERS
jgi:hypothetical protein